ncbi:hypothetical protein J6590_039295 [Homalodisca vitripennis]|nr:hypothetical protein J6590_039295 [Homalodisca vitripennis]
MFVVRSSYSTVQKVHTHLFWTIDGDHLTTQAGRLLRYETAFVHVVTFENGPRLSPPPQLLHQKPAVVFIWVFKYRYSESKYRQPHTSVITVPEWTVTTAVGRVYRKL